MADSLQELQTWVKVNVAMPRVRARPIASAPVRCCKYILDVRGLPAPVLGRLQIFVVINEASDNVLETHDPAVASCNPKAASIHTTAS
jgi:hypothetical protein